MMMLFMKMIRINQKDIMSSKETRNLMLANLQNLKVVVVTPQKKTIGIDMVKNRNAQFYSVTVE